MASKTQHSKGSQSLKKGTGISSPSVKRLYTLSEAGNYLGRSVYSVRGLIWKGALPVVKDSKKQWLDVLDLDSWIEKNKEVVV